MPEIPSNKEKKPALAAALSMLSYKDYSKSKLKEKLLKKGYAEGEAEAAITRLEKLKLLDDREAALSKFRFLYENSKNSVREIKQKLLKKGYSKEDIEEAMPENAEERELSAALKALGIKFKKNKDPLKMRGYLFRHGFGSWVAKEAARIFSEEG